MIPTLGMLMSTNGPQWDDDEDSNRPGDRRRPGRPNQGPPDLEEFYQDIRRRIEALFGKRRNGGGPRGNGPARFDPKAFWGGLVLALALLFLLWIASGFYIVDAPERGLVLRFGKYTHTTEPGLHLRWPYPIESHEIVNLTEVRSVTVGYRGDSKVLRESLMLTDDENIIDIQFSVQYLLQDPVDYLFQNRDPDEAVMQAAETAVREIVGKSKIDFVINTGRAQIAEQVSKLMQEILDRYQTGILISKVNMQNAQPPEQVQAAFADAVKAGQDKENQINEGEAYAKDIIPKAKGTAARLLEEAEGYRQRVIANAEGEASRFQQIQAEYARAPEVTRQRLYLETMQHIYANTSKVMVDAKGQGNLLYLPLDKLMQQAGAGVAAQAGNADAGVAASNSITVFSGSAPPLSESERPDASRELVRDLEAGK
ncbi:MAG: FtsH protease activity modulator HflK [Zoogloeaceae bacterium]|jgi:membrane protease subunit HflK|nr:FtsH protease activity modulator HflK [Zoogloeaceae bacterium]